MNDDTEIKAWSLTDKEQVAYDNAYARLYEQSKSHAAADEAGMQALADYRRALRLRREARENGAQS